MTSKPDTAFVWFWLPGATEPRIGKGRSFDSTV